jgi:hypothetical protein
LISISRTEGFADSWAGCESWSGKAKADPFKRTVSRSCRPSAQTLSVRENIRRTESLLRTPIVGSMVRTETNHAARILIDCSSIGANLGYDKQANNRNCVCQNIQRPTWFMSPTRKVARFRPRTSCGVIKMCNIIFAFTYYRLQFLALGFVSCITARISPGSSRAFVRNR